MFTRGYLEKRHLSTILEMLLSFWGGNGRWPMCLRAFCFGPIDGLGRQNNCHKKNMVHFKKLGYKVVPLYGRYIYLYTYYGL